MKSILIISLIFPVVLYAQNCPEWVEFEMPPSTEHFQGEDPEVVAEAARRGLINSHVIRRMSDIVSVYRHGNGEVGIYTCSEQNESVGRFCVHADMVPEYYEHVRDALMCKQDG